MDTRGFTPLITLVGVLALASALFAGYELARMQPVTATTNQATDASVSR
jgi:hypothetical protein